MPPSPWRAQHTSASAGLHAKRSATAQELDDATGALRAAEARATGAAARTQAAVSGVEGARAASEAAGTTESFALVTAPFDGVVTEKMVEPGNMAAPGTPLMRLEDTRGFRLDVRVDESRIGQISPGAVVPVSLDSGAGGATTTIERHGGGRSAARSTPTRARFSSRSRCPMPPACARARSAARTSAPETRRALTVPAGALVRRGQMTSVFVVEKGIARVRLVNVSGTEVLAGLSEGDVVIVAAPSTVTDGRRVAEGGR